MTRRLLASLLLLACASPALAQLRVEVPVVVAEKDGKAVAGLTKDDFEIRSRAGLAVTSVQSVEVLRVDASKPESTPVFVLFDPAALGLGEARNVQKELWRLLEGSASRREPVTVVVVTKEGVRVVHDSATDPEVLAAALKASSAQTAGSPAVAAEYDRLRLLRDPLPTESLTGPMVVFRQLATLEQLGGLLRQYPRRKGLVWITGYFPVIIDGDAMELDTMPVERNFARLPESYAAAVLALVGGRVTVYPVQLSGGRQVMVATDTEGRTRMGLDQFAQSTAGKNLRRSLLETVAQARGDQVPYYLVSADSTKGQGASKWVSVRISVKGRSAKTWSPDLIFLVP